MFLHLIFFNLANQKKSWSSCYTPVVKDAVMFFETEQAYEPLIYSIQQNIQTLLPIKQTLLFSDVTAVSCYSYPVMSVRRRVACLDKDHLANNPSPYALNRYIKNNRHFIYSAALCLCRCCVSNPNVACSIQKSNSSFFFFSRTFWIISVWMDVNKLKTSVDSDHCSTILFKASPYKNINNPSALFPKVKRSTEPYLCAYPPC